VKSGAGIPDFASLNPVTPVTSITAIFRISMHNARIQTGRRRTMRVPSFVVASVCTCIVLTPACSPALAGDTGGIKGIVTSNTGKSLPSVRQFFRRGNRNPNDQG
jgi:hypothetical protein